MITDNLKKQRVRIFELKLEIKYLNMKSFSKDQQIENLKKSVEKSRIANNTLKQKNNELSIRNNQLCVEYWKVVNKDKVKK